MRLGKDMQCARCTKKLGGLFGAARPQEHPERPKWCYLTAEHVEALGITQKNPITQNLAQNDLEPNNLKLGSVEENMGGRSLAWLGHRLPKPTTRVRIPVTAPKAACALFQ